MALNIPVPITELERKGTLSVNSLFIIETGDVTKNITWSGLLARINFSDTLTFGFGSVELPSVCFIDSFSGFYAPQLGSVAISTDHSEKLAVRPGGLVEFGDPLLKETSLTQIKGNTRLKCSVRFLENLQIEKNLRLESDIQLNGENVFEDVSISGEGDGSNLIVYGDYVKFGKDCFQNLSVNNISTGYCDVDAKENIVIKKDLDNNTSIYNTTISTKDIIVAKESTLGSVKIHDDVTIDDGGPVYFTKEGNITTTSIPNIPTSGDVNVGGAISGDGQSITNLNLPNSIRLKGSIDPTTQGPPDPPQHGDLWYSSADGNFNNLWVGLSGEPVTIGKPFYYFATPTPNWVLGAISDLQSPFFMKIDLTQTVTGDKTFQSEIVAQNTIDTTDIVAGNLGLTGKGQSALTVAGDNGQTITTKSYVDGRMTNATLDFNLNPSKYILGQKYDGSVPRTWNIDGSFVGSDNIVARNSEGNFSANVITATFLDGIATDTKTLDIFQSDSDSEHPVTLVTSTGLSRQVYSDSDFTYNPVTDTLSVDFVVSDITGDVTGNVDTATKFETGRFLWGQLFDGTSDVSGNVTDAGNITSQENNTKNIGTSDNVFSDVYSDTFYGTLLGNVSVGDSTREDLINGDHVLGGLWNGSVATTWTVEGTPNFSLGKIVIRDNLGNFSSDRIEAVRFFGPLTGNVTGNITGSSSSVTGNTATATKFETSRFLWTQPFNGTSNVDSSILNVNDIVPSQGSTYDIGSENLPFSTLYVDEIFGDVDNNATSTDKLGNALGRGDYIEGTLSQWDGSVSDTWSLDPQSTSVPNKIVIRNLEGNFNARVVTASFVGDLSGNVTGNASGTSSSVTGNTATATEFQLGRQLWGNFFDGTQNIISNINLTGNILPEIDDEYDLGEVGLQFKDVYAGSFKGNIKNNIESSNGLVNYLFSGNYFVGEDWNGSEQTTWTVDSDSLNVSNTVVNRDSTGSFNASVITSNLIGALTGNVTGTVSGSSNEVTGNTATCTRLVTERTIDVKLEGSLEGSGTFGLLGGDRLELLAPIEVVRKTDIRNLEPLPE